MILSSTTYFATQTTPYATRLVAIRTSVESVNCSMTAMAETANTSPIRAMVQNGSTSFRKESGPLCFHTHRRLRMYAGIADKVAEITCDTTPPKAKTVRHSARRPWPVSTLTTDTPQ